MKTAQLYLTRDEYHAGGLQGLWAVGVFPTQPQENNGVVWSKHIHCACWWIVCISWSPVCFPLISQVMEQWMSPSIHTSCSACTVQSTDVSNPASLHHCCSTFLVLTTQASLALSLSGRDAAGLLSPELAWKHSGNEQGLNGGHGHFAGLAVCSAPWESLGLLAPWFVHQE